MANFRLAVTARIKDGEGWRDGETSFFRVNVWRQLAEHVAESLSKGDRAVVSCQPQVGQLAIQMPPSRCRAGSGWEWVG